MSREVVSAYVKRSSSERSPSLNLLSQFSRLFSSSFWVIFHSFKSTCTMLLLSTSCSLYGGYSNTASTHIGEHERKGRGNSIKKKKKAESAVGIKRERRTVLATSLCRLFVRNSCHLR